jgi:hypothetical protein
MKTGKTFRIVLGVCTLASVLVGVANAAFISNVVNGGFETNTNGSSAYNADVPGWSIHPSSDTAPPLGIWVYGNMNSGDQAGAPTFIDGAGLGLFVRGDGTGGPVPQTSWVYQSLGTVDSADLGKKYSLAASAGAMQQEAGSVDISVAFATDVSGSSLGTALASATKNVASLGLGNGPNQLSAFSADFVPTAANLGQTVYARISIDNVVAGHYGENQYLVDGVSLTSSPVPEPSVTALLSTGLVALLACAWRKRK